MDQSILSLAPTQEIFLGQEPRAVDEAAAVCVSRVPALLQGRGHRLIVPQLHIKIQTLVKSCNYESDNKHIFIFFNGMYLVLLEWNRTRSLGTRRSRSRQ